MVIELLNPKKEDEINCILYFLPSSLNIPEISEDAKLMYFELVEKGKHKDKINSYSMDAFNCLVQGKRWRGIHVGMYEEGVLDGSVPYSVLFDDAPNFVIKFMAKQMFKGLDKDIILSYLR